MNLILRRTVFDINGIFGELTGYGCHFYTLEHSYNNQPKLPPGKYSCVRGIHKLHDGIPFEAFQVMDVPGHEGILLHKGNYNSDSDGCVLIGKGLDLSKNMITESKDAFDELMLLQSSFDSFTLTVV
jgi:hypothetical protein